jgi:chromosome segregation ATPase
VQSNQVRDQVLKLRSQANQSQSTLQKHIQQVNSLTNELDTKTKALDKVETSIDSLRHDIIAVETKHKDEMLHTIAIEQSKENVENELHDLTQRLFEEANQMVLKEKEEKQELQKLFDGTKIDLNETETELGFVQAELQKLKDDMVDSNECVAMDSHASTSTVHQNYLLRAQLDMNTMHHQNDDEHAAAITTTTTTTTTNINKLEIEAVEDDTLVAEFQQFRETIDTVPLRKIQTLPFMKLCLKSDIEPCLRFGPNPKLSAKKISDAILVKSCFVEPCPPGFATEEMNQRQKKNQEKAAKSRLWERFSNPTHSFFGCPACGRVIDPDQRDHILSWRFRISYFDEWSCIDRFCRDRIASVIEFYTFLRRLKVGVYKDAPLLGVYRECSRLKAQMFLSR